MMKLLFASILLSTVIAALPAGAQEGTKHYHHAPGTKAGHQGSSSWIAVDSRATTPVASRLVGMTKRKYKNGYFVPVDSVLMSFSASRWSNSSIANNTKYTKADKVVWLEYDDQNCTWKNAARSTNTYDASDNLLTSVEEEWSGGIKSWVPKTRSTNCFDSCNNCISGLIDEWDPEIGVWDNARCFTATYNIRNKLDTLTHEGWDRTEKCWHPRRRIVRVYDAASNLTECLIQYAGSVVGEWENDSRNIISYDMFGNIKEDHYQTWNYALWEWKNGIRFTNSYDTKHNKIVEVEEEWSSLFNRWESFSRTTYTGFTNHEPRCAFIQYGDAARHISHNKYRNTYTYNNFFQPIEQMEKVWDDSSSSWVHQEGDYIIRYYYETYNTAVPVVASRNGKANLYPVPANSTVHISITWDEAQPFTLSILDMAGKTYALYNVASCTKYQEQVPISHLPAGNYTVHIVGTKGSITEHLVVGH